jgi:mitochondrial fission protein ELM1
MPDTSIDLNEVAHDGRDSELVWVLEDPRDGTSAQAIGIAERLGLRFRRVPLCWNWLAHVALLSPRGSLVGLAAAARTGGPPNVTRVVPHLPRSRLPVSLPEAGGPVLTMSAGARTAAVALWMQARLGTRAVHCMRPMLHGREFALLVVGEHDRPPDWPNVVPVLGAPHRLSPIALRYAEAAWSDRLAHLPHPLLALLVGGPAHATDMVPAKAHALGLRMAALARKHGGSVLATTTRRTGRQATDALAAGLGSAIHVLHRWGEPGENPYAGFLACADAVVVTGDSVAMLSEACATEAPVFIALPELGGARQRRLHASLIAAEEARLFGDDLPRWPRRPLDEAGRVAQEIMRRSLLDLTRTD